VPQKTLLSLAWPRAMLCADGPATVTLPFAFEDPGSPPLGLPRRVDSERVLPTIESVNSTPRDAEGDRHVELQDEVALRLQATGSAKKARSRTLAKVCAVACQAQARTTTKGAVDLERHDRPTPGDRRALRPAPLAGVWCVQCALHAKHGRMLGSAAGGHKIAGNAVCDGGLRSTCR